MSYQQTFPSDKDPHLWEIAKKRASFKSHFLVYLTVNVFFWVLWYLGNENDHNGVPWPVFPGIGWGIGVVFHYIGAYTRSEETAVEKEYNKLINSKR